VPALLPHGNESGGIQKQKLNTVFISQQMFYTMKFPGALTERAADFKQSMKAESVLIR